MSWASVACPPCHPLLGPAWRPTPLVSAQTSPDGKPEPIPAALSLLQTPRAPPSAP